MLVLHKKCVPGFAQRSLLQVFHQHCMFISVPSAGAEGFWIPLDE